MTKNIQLNNSNCVVFFFFKQKTAYEMRISDWSSDVCSSDLQLVDDRTRHGDSTDQCHVCPLIHGEDRVNDRGQTLPHLVLGIVGLVRLDVVQDDQVGTTVHGVNET